MVGVIAGVVVASNACALFAYVGGFTAVFDVVLGIACSSWLIRFYGLWVLGLDGVVSVVPADVPIALGWFLVLVEVVSLLVRPFTLAVRLAANITAGHLLLNLFSTLGMGWLLLPLELLVAIVQSFVLVLLVTSWYTDVLCPVDVL